MVNRLNSGLGYNTVIAMTAEPTPPTGNSLTDQAFGAFLNWFSPDHETAATQYLKLREKLVTFFKRKGCAHSDELADRTLDRAAVIAWKEPGKYPNPQALCYGVAGRVWLEYCKEIVPGELDPENIPTPDREDCDFKEHETVCLSFCMDGLPQRERDLIMQYHRFRGQEKIEVRRRLSEEYGGLNQLRIKTCRIRAKLHNCIQSCVRQTTAQ